MTDRYVWDRGEVEVEDGPAGVARALAHEKVGHTGQGLWHHKGMQLPAYIQHIANDLIASGHPESQAIQMAIGICQRWARGGGDVTPETQAKAAAAVAEWNRLKAKAKVTRSEPMSDGYDGDGLDASWDGDLGDVPDLSGLDVPDFEALTGDTPDTGASRAAPALGSGARFKALKGKLASKGASNPGALAAYIGRKKFGRAKFSKLASTARKRKGGGMSRSAADWREITRDVPVEDIHIMRTAEGDGTGRVVEAYAAVFEQPTDIDDHQGKYREVIDRSAFSDTLARIGSRRGGLASALRVLYNHGKTMEGVPAPEFQQPLGRPVFVEADSQGLLTRTEYARTPLADNTLELIRAGAITTQSFVGGIIRSDPMLRGPGDEYRMRNGMRQTVRRMALGLREYGPVLWAAYTGAEILGVRSQLPSPDELDVQPGFEDEDPDVDGELTGGTPEEVTPSRSHAHRLWQIHYEDMARQAGIITERVND